MLTCVGFLIYFTCSSSVPPETFCQIYRPVYLSREDTRKTKEDTDTNNRIYKKLCLEKATP